MGSRICGPGMALCPGRAQAAGMNALDGLPRWAIGRSGVYWSRALFRRSDRAVANQAFRKAGVGRLIARKPIKLAAVALANKMARIAWALLTRFEVYRTAQEYRPLPTDAGACGASALMEVMHRGGHPHMQASIS